MKNNTPIKDPVILKEHAIKAAGSAAKLARLLAISRASISAWKTHVPPYQAYRIVQIFPNLNNNE